MGSRIKAVAKKEVKQLLRDKRMLFVIFFFPVFLLGVFGYAVNFDVKHIQMGVLDLSRSQESREIINSLTSSEYFDYKITFRNDREIRDALDKKDVQCVIVFPRDLTEKLYTPGAEVKLQVLIDGVDGNTATIIMNYVKGATLAFDMQFKENILARLGRTIELPLGFEPIFWFNPDLKSTWFLIPGLIAMILIVTAVVSVSLTLVREKERGTIEQINVSSINTIELLIGKSLPYIFIALINAIFILTAGYLLFGLEIQGSYVLLFISTLIFIIASVSMGIFVSVVADSQQVAFTIATFLSLLPSVILSGFIFPIDSMPWVVQIITNVTPAKFFLQALRAIILRGAGLPAFWQDLIYLGVFIFVFLTAATLISKRKSAI
ncbi:MAG: membrane protein [Melioribacteraceae bacterium]|nr:MAG: membrane protein [Melioribacteraceae bacterium]